MCVWGGGGGLPPPGYPTGCNESKVALLLTPWPVILLSELYTIPSHDTGRPVPLLTRIYRMFCIVSKFCNCIVLHKLFAVHEI